MAVVALNEMMDRTGALADEPVKLSDETSSKIVDLAHTDSSSHQRDDLAGFVRHSGEGLSEIDFIIPNMNCAGCMSKIERHFSKDETIQRVRVNLTQRLVHFEWKHGESAASLIAEGLKEIGFQAMPYIEGDSAEVNAERAELNRLLWSLGVAGFAAANVMLLSVSVWSGATGATRDLFHWLSALIAMPAVAYAGQPFFSSAWQALRSRSLNMDVPISLAVILATGISLFETAHHGEHAFFDAALTLLFFLLIGRTLDRLMRERAFAGVRQLLALKTHSATVISETGEARIVPLAEIKTGDVVLVLPGETIPVDGRIKEGLSDIDWALVNGEAMPKSGGPGDEVFSGLVNLSGPLRVTTEAVGDKTLLAEIVRLMGLANERAPAYRLLADRAASLYAPTVHLLAALTFVGWLVFGASWQVALYTAISVLIITCPCALGLAVPVVQVVASSIAHRHGVLMKDGRALEKLSDIDCVVFDKTGTLTLASAELTGSFFDHEVLMPAAISLAKNSLHPLSKALVRTGSATNIEPAELRSVTEHPGQGLSAEWNGGELRLGSYKWCGIDETISSEVEADLVLWASFKGKDGSSSSALFTFEDRLRPGVKAVISYFQKKNIKVHLLSGDRSCAVERLAQCLDITEYKGELKPAEKCSYVEKLGDEGKKVLMVGDGINDGPSLKAAYVSLSPSCASEVAQVSAGFVMMGESMLPLVGLHKLARSSKVLIGQNFGLAILYNLIAVPIAVMGAATPIVAAIAMSLSSMIVTVNALRLNYLSRSYLWDKDR